MILLSKRIVLCENDKRKKKRKSENSRVLLTRLLSVSAHAAWADIATIAEVVSPKASDRAAFLEECKSGVFDDVGVAYRTFDSFKITGRIDKEVVGALPGLNFLCHNGEQAAVARGYLGDS